MAVLNRGYVSNTNCALPLRTGPKACRPKDFLNGFRGYLHSDGYDAYHKLEGVVSVGCLVHVRRKFVEAVEAAGKSKGSSNLAGKAVKDLQQIFDWDSYCANMTLEERYQKRLEKQKPFLEAFFDWVESISVSEKSALGRPEPML